MHFKYFQDARYWSTYTPEKRDCELCHRTQTGFEGPFYGMKEFDFVCEQCLAEGRLAEADASTNQGDLSQLLEQLAAEHPELDESQIKEIERERTYELMHCTPFLVTWQDFFWPAHCGDYCCFIKEVGKPDLNDMSPDGEGESYFREHVCDEVPDGLWEAIRSDSPTDDSVSYTVGVYLFQCLHCGEYVILWDTD